MAEELKPLWASVQQVPYSTMGYGGGAQLLDNTGACIGYVITLNKSEDHNPKELDSAVFRAVEGASNNELRARHDERKKIIAQGCIHTVKAEDRDKGARVDVSEWQAEQREYFQAPIVEIVSEYAAWRDARESAHIERIEAVNESYRSALDAADDAIREMFRYYDGGETRGSYDGKPERNQLRKAGYDVRAALAKSDASLGKEIG